jgi:hypothetical protein
MSNKRLVGWLVAVRGPKDPMPRLYCTCSIAPKTPLERDHAKRMLCWSDQSERFPLLVAVVRWPPLDAQNR